MKSQHCAVILLVLAGILGCKVQALRHDQQAAATRAEQFMTLAVVEQNFAAASAMLRPEDRNQTSQAVLAEAVKKQHGDGYPEKIRAMEYEPVPGQAAIQIFLIGEKGPARFYYRVPMLGTTDTGYSPNGFFRGTGPYPESALRQALTK